MGELELAQQTLSSEKVGMFMCFITMLNKIHAKVTGMFSKLKKIAEDDPRRVSHSLKVGLALTLVSLVYYVTPLFNGFGSSSAMWAVLTVVVVMEYTVGGTLGKGINRTLATVLAGSLALGAHHLADLCGDKVEPVLLGVLVFILKRYDYGVTIFILTFSLVAVSSYRVDEIIPMAQQRASTIALGVATCLCLTIFVFPVWAGEDLHNMAATNLEKLASFLEGLGDDYFQEKEKARENKEEKRNKSTYLQSYKSVLNSRASEESLVNFAKWEPGHGGFGFRHPWDQYLKIGASTRQCAYSMEALTALLKASDPKPKPDPNDVRNKIRSACAEMSSESAKGLSDLAASIRTMSVATAARQHMAAASAAADKLKALLSDGGEVAEIVHVATIGAILVEIVKCGEEIAGTVEELARLAGFKLAEAVNGAPVKPGSDDGQCPHVVITVRGD
ncbi:hypothetical protein J5N97_021303 [Dioscorea zingiberensis]|uniref:Aluminum-activated malate transporter n=1 Tax=Dioscorea zingiberensis TaxID=325984 RepID=A0A9D5CI31_9LILI|nr:hypothetical protein J5N97_021303 [Dioscorea zingiberensis]